MPLAAGDKLGPYEIVAPIGKGGMGEVYRATDTRLGRAVAIKVSSREFNDRFEREARAISALNHPHICTLYDVGPNYLVMELVEGELLSRALDRGPLPLDKALAFAIQIVDALAAAHAKGIIHRDLKPGNIMITSHGVKVLDFGLAKLGSEKPSAASAAEMETVTEPITRAGAVLGTLYYMSPEQVEGKETDARSDIFSFGVVLHEMISGQRPFSGDTQAGVLAALLKDQPPRMSARRPETPRTLERVVRRCLEKKPDDRWQSARDLKPTLELIDLDAAQPPDTSSSSVPIPMKKPSRKPWLWAGIGVAALVAIGAGVWTMWPKPAPARATRFQVTLPDNVTFDTYVSVSPDGHKLLFNATGAQSGLWIHDLDTLEWRKLEGTEGGGSPFWSPDSKYLGFAVGSVLKKIDIAGGPPQTVCTIAGLAGTGAWSKDGVILFGTRAAGSLRKVSASGGVPTDVTALAQNDRFHALPTFLPDGKHFLYLRATPSPEAAGIYAGSLDSKPADQPKERILANTLAASYVDGNLFFMRDGTLMVQPFDAGKLQLRGEPVPVAEHVAVAGSIGVFSVSLTGVLAYRAGTVNSGYQTTWFDRQGKTAGTFGQIGPDVGLHLSPDGTRSAGRDAIPGAAGDIWMLDFSRLVRSRFTFRQSQGSYPVWTPDGKRVVFSAGNTLDTILEKSADGSSEETELFKRSGEIKVPDSISKDGRFLLFHTYLTPKTNGDLWVLPLEGAGPRQPVLLLGTDFAEGAASFSPDGRWIAYVSNESGRFEVYVRPFDTAKQAFGEGKWQVSRDGVVVNTGTLSTIRWRADGKELLFEGLGNAIMSVDVDGGSGAFQMRTPKPLFSESRAVSWDITPDGKKFLFSLAPTGGGQTPITVVLNWQADLKK